MNILGIDIEFDYSSSNIPPRCINSGTEPNGIIVPWIRYKKVWYILYRDIIEFTSYLESKTSTEEVKQAIYNEIRRLRKELWMIGDRNNRPTFIESLEIPIFDNGWDTRGGSVIYTEDILGPKLRKTLPRMRYGDTPKKIIIEQFFKIVE